MRLVSIESTLLLFLLALNDTNLNLLEQKHPCQSEAGKHFLFDDIPGSIHKISMNA